MSIRKKRILVYIIMIICGVISIGLLRDIWALKKTDSRFLKAETELKEAQMEQQSLKAQIEKIKSRDFWEKQVRNKLMMAKENEVVVLVPEEIINVQAEEGVSEEEGEKPAWRLWWELLVS